MLLSIMQVRYCTYTNRESCHGYRQVRLVMEPYHDLGPVQIPPHTTKSLNPSQIYQQRRALDETLSLVESWANYSDKRGRAGVGAKPEERMPRADKTRFRIMTESRWTTSASYDPCSGTFLDDETRLHV